MAHIITPEVLLTNEHQWIREVGLLFLERRYSQLSILDVQRHYQFKNDLLYLKQHNKIYVLCFDLETITLFINYDIEYFNIEYFNSFASVRGALDYLEKLL